MQPRSSIPSEKRGAFTDFIDAMYKNNPDIKIRETLEVLQTHPDWAQYNLKWFHVHTARKRLGLVKHHNRKPEREPTTSEPSEVVQEEYTFNGFMEKLKELEHYGKQMQKAQRDRLNALFF